MSEKPEITLTCRACGRPMVERVNSKNQSTFLGCSAYPTCLETAKLPAFLEVKRAGGVPLPGFESES